MLESWFGFSLFRRGQNSLELTAEGKALLPTLKAALDSIAQVAGELRDDNHTRRVRIAAYPNLAMKWLVPRLARLRARVPNAEIEIVTKIRPLPELFAECDLVIRTYEDAAQFSFDYLFAAELFPVSAPGLVTEENPCPADLLRYPLLRLRHSPHDWRLWFESVGVKMGEPSRTLWFDSQAVMMEAVRYEHGIALARSPFDDRAVAEEALRRLSPHSMTCDESWYVITPAALRRGTVWDVKAALLEEANDNGALASPVALQPAGAAARPRR